MDTFRKTFINTLLLLAIAAMAFYAGFLTHERFGSPARSGEQFPILIEAFSLLQTHGFNDLPAGPAVEYGMIRGMLQAYADPFTSFLEPVQEELSSNSLHGSFGGIGVTLDKDDEGYWIMYPYEDSPAARAGILEGDRILSVDGLAITADTPLDTLQAAVRGLVGERVTIEVGRPPDYQPVTVRIKREEIPLPSVTSHQDTEDPRLGIIQVFVIADTTPDEILKAAGELTANGATHFVLDLRNNGGGLLNAGVDIARIFLTEGDIMQQQYRGKDVVTYSVDKRGSLAAIPLVVWVNGNTASASEIIAGALQVQGRALLIGTNTFGKNTIQLVFNLQDESSLHVTSAKWWIPSLEFPKEGHGLEPDIIVTDDPTKSRLIIDASLQAFFENP